MKPDTLLEATMTKLKLSYFGHVVRRQEKIIMLGKIDGTGKGEDQT